MIIPTHCKSCGRPIGHLWFNYLAKIKEYTNSNEDNQDKTPEASALDDLNIHKYCCRLNFLCQPRNIVDMLRNREQ